MFVGDNSHYVPHSAQNEKIKMTKWLEFFICFLKHLKAKGKYKEEDNG